MKFGALLSASLIMTGCASNLAQMQTARTLEPGQIRMSGGVGWYLPVTQIGAIAGTGVQIAKQGIEAAINEEEFQLSDANKRRLALNSVALQAMPPSPSAQLDLRVGVLPRVDVGLRYAIDSVRADAKLNFFHDGTEDPEDGLPRKSKDLALGFAVSKSLWSRSISDPNGLVKIDGFSRWDFEVPLYASIDVSRYFGVYGSGRYRFSTIRFDQHVTQVNDCGCGGVPTRTTTVTPSQMVSHFYGATVGIRVGNHRFTWMLELTLGQTTARTRLLDADVELGGFTLYPATGIALTF